MLPRRTEEGKVGLSDSFEKDKQTKACRNYRKIEGYAEV